MSQYYTQGFPDSYKNGRGIPRVEFVQDVPAYLKAKDVSAESLLSMLHDSYSKYKVMEYKLNQSKEALKNKIPEIKKTLEMVQHLKAKVDSITSEDEEVVNTYIGLSDNVYVNAVVKGKPNTVGLWLGANVMVQYSYEEAISLLQKNLQTATENLNRTMEDLAFLRDQLTINEVNIARVYNFDVKQRRATTNAATSGSSSSSGGTASSSSSSGGNSITASKTLGAK